MRSIWLRALVLGLLTTSCAASTAEMQPAAHSMPAARAGLRPEYRIFYDTLNDYGQWLLIEPMGYVFRPQTEFNDWSPYAYGYWAPSDSYGWVWVSSEPYGWATYHYGRWFYDDFQGWVWVPGAEWAPAWVAWQQTGPYVGWAPLAPGGTWNQPRTAAAPNGGFVYTDVQQLGSTSMTLKKPSELGAQAATAKPVVRSVLIDGVRTPAGPSLEAVERASGRPLQRVKLADLVQREEPAPTATVKHKEADATHGNGSDRVLEARRAGEQAASESKSAQQAGGAAPARIPVVRPWGMIPAGHKTAAARDTTP
jgi:hypothetical protein